MISACQQMTHTLGWVSSPTGGGGGGPPPVKSRFQTKAPTAVTPATTSPSKPSSNEPLRPGQLPGHCGDAYPVGCAANSCHCHWPPPSEVAEASVKPDPASAPLPGAP